MADDPLDLFDEGGDAEESAALDVYGQDGPDLFGTEPDELILPPEPVAADDPEVDVEMDTMDEIPIEEPDDDPPQVEPAGSALVRPVETQAPPPRGHRPEAPLALYRRYRPDTFADVIGQEQVTAPLQRALANNRVNHAYLFSGPRGCGKTTSARILARCLNCAQGPTPTPCGVCRSCLDLARGGTGSIDVIEIDAASHGGVDEARDLRERAFFAPVSSRYKIYIIDEAHMVTTQGFNALLKVVEEPPPHVKFIFATTEPEKVIGTIRSRTHHYPFRLVPPRTLSAYLGQVCAAEGVRVEESVLPLVVRAGAGSVRDSLSVLDQLLGGAAETGVTHAQAAALLGYTPDSLLDSVMDAFAAGDAESVFSVIDKVMEVGQDPRRFAEDLLRRLRDLIIVAAVPDAFATGLVDVAGDQAERLTTQAAGMGPGELTRAAEVIAKGLTEMRGTTAPRLHLELMCARVLLPGADVDVRGVHARLDRLERRLNMAAPERLSAVERPSAPEVTPPDRAPSPVEKPSGRPSRPVETPQDGSSSAVETPPDPWRSPEPAQPVAERAQPAAEPELARAEAAASDPGTVSTAGIRSMWPQVLDAVKNRRRVTWIVLRE
ncbi:DNA polymerase III subunit gamma and tau, partial [Propioniciclava sp.]|uniref:DNA polymerase III subunit gamma and tau n=1 Tax=Propioniciclava sp. TaxID=2038686 RepID=UPI002603E48D